MARERLVRRISFKPLLIDGSLAINDDGFAISLRCEESEIEEYTRRLQSDHTGKSLPWRTRFTLAHEIAHTFFFDISCRPPRTKVNFENPRTLHSLERSCNRAALQLLLPEATFADRYRGVDFLLPKLLRQLSSDAAISAPAIVVRFNYLRRVSHPFGILICAERSPKGFVINSISRHSGLRSVFKDVDVGQPLTALISDKNFLLNGGKLEEIPVADDNQANKLLGKFIARCERSRPSSSIGGVFVTLQPEIEI
jgi:hypothetical protein